MDPGRYCAERAAAPGSTLYYATLFLEPDKRRAVHALHALGVELDETVRECSEPGVGRVRLEWWREELGRLYAGEPRHPVSLALREARRHWDLPAEELMQVFEAREQDLLQARHPGFDALRLHCHRSYGVVAMLSADVCGYRHHDTRRFAQRYGVAARIAEILRTLREDALRGRVYLPEDDLARHGVAREALAAGEESAAVAGLVAEQAGRGRALLDEAEALLPRTDRHPQHPLLIAAGIYRVLLRQLERAGPRALARRRGVTPLRKLWIAWRTERRARRI